jgi:plasmid stabilisation system protein
MVKYRVDITDEALADMESLYEYIKFKLLAPENAMGQYNRIARCNFDIRFIPRTFRAV